MEKNKRIVNYILLFLIVIFLILLSLFLILSRLQKNDSSKKSDTATPTSFPSFPFNNSNLGNKNFYPSITSKPSTTPSTVLSITPIPKSRFTGAKEEPIDPQLIKKSNQILDLMKKTPVILDNLKINYDFKTEKFIVSPQSGTFAFTQEEREKIYQWFEKNYPDIPKDKIIFSSTPYVTPTPIPRPSTVLPLNLSPTRTITFSEDNKNLKINYDFKTEKFIVSPQSGTFAFTQEEREKIYQWFEKNYPDIPKDKIIFSSTPYVSSTSISQQPSTSSRNNETESIFKELLKFLKTIFDIASINNNFTSPPSVNNQNSSNQQSTSKPLAPISYQPPQTQYPYVYYPQCDGPFDNYPLPGGCTICYAGCGPTTVAMIVASYKDKSIDPRYIVNEYGKAVGCEGSSYVTAMNILRNHGITVGEPLYFSHVKAEEVASIFKRFIDAGKTIFANADFSAGGHYFWIIDVDQNNNIWSFDPYYGRFQIPYNQNTLYPYPLYKLVFTVSP